MVLPLRVVDLGVIGGVRAAGSGGGVLRVSTTDDMLNAKEGWGGRRGRSVEKGGGGRKRLYR